MKVIITADWHAGVPRKLSYTLWAARAIRRYAIQEKIKNVIILGDLFHDRVNLNIEVLNAIYAFFEQDRVDEMAEKPGGVQWYAFPGNHDMFLKNSWDIHSLKPLASLVIIQPTIGKVGCCDSSGTQNFWIIPFIYDEQQYMKELAAVEKKIKSDDILLTHIGVCGAKLNECFLLKNWSFVNFDKTKFNLAFAGHFHCHQTVGNITYPGSPVAFRFDEGLVPHGFIVCDTDKMKWEFINIRSIGTEGEPPPLYLTVLDADADKKPPEFFKGNNVRLILTKDYTKEDLSKLDKMARERGALGVSWIRPKEKDVEIEAARKSEVDMKTPEKLLERWLEKEKPEGLNYKILAKLNAQIIAEAEERISVQVSED